MSWAKMNSPGGIVYNYVVPESLRQSFINSFGAMVPYLGPSFIIRYAMRRRKNCTQLKVMIYTLLESQRQELSLWRSNLGNPFSRNYTNPTTIS